MGFDTIEYVLMWMGLFVNGWMRCLSLRRAAIPTSRARLEFAADVLADLHETLKCTRRALRTFQCLPNRKMGTEKCNKGAFTGEQRFSAPSS
jgi:hypothetical protein